MQRYYYYTNFKIFRYFADNLVVGYWLIVVR